MAQRGQQALKDASKPGITAEAFLACLSRSLISTLLAKAGVKGESLTYAEAEMILKSKGFSVADAGSASRLLEKIDSVRFSGQELDSRNRETLLSETRELVGKIT